MVRVSRTITVVRETRTTAEDTNHGRG